MSATADTLVSALADLGEPLDDEANCYLEVDTEERQAIIVWVEPLVFHAGWNNHRKWQARPAIDRWSRYVDADGWLTRAAADAIVARLQGYIGDCGKVYELEYGGDEPSITFEIVTEYEDGETFDHWFDRVGWPIVATLRNVTDPGAFMSPYLFDMGSLP
ncbi:hypothetical protein LITTLEE_212 [Mycobacterium phage LittleE]|uniref:Uncharacterized protein n=1 Tax=Mycobacterium phage LittleE TaxID=2922212 RepID=G1D496_9CAUD|nr:hypothetical protein FGG27_gp208 [Mycobacterium phage LittleE]AEK09589.1 hypothetical protein LITTLEE_212 [Mycobacterium phage LittleE]